jgi:hypothetical protein
MKIKDMEKFLRLEETGSIGKKKNDVKKPKTEEWSKQSKKIIQKRRWKSQ